MLSSVSHFGTPTNMSIATLYQCMLMENSDVGSMKLMPTWVMMSVNGGNLLSSTKFNHTMSRIQLNGFGGHVFRSRAAPPCVIFKELIMLQVFITNRLIKFPGTDEDLTFDKNLKLVVLYFVVL